MDLRPTCRVALGLWLCSLSACGSVESAEPQGPTPAVQPPLPTPEPPTPVAGPDRRPRRAPKKTPKPPPFRANATMSGPAVGELAGRHAQVHADRCASPHASRVCVPGATRAWLLSFRFEVDFGNEFISYRLIHAPVHVQGETELASGELQYDLGESEQLEGPFTVDRLPGIYSFRIAVRKLRLPRGYTIGAELTVDCHDSSPEREAARIALRETPHSFELRGLENAIANLNFEFRAQTAVHEVIEVYELVTLAADIGELGASLAHRSARAALAGFAKGFAISVVESVALSIVKDSVPDPRGLRAEDIVLRHILLRCLYCESSFRQEDIRSGDVIRCTRCGTGIEVHLRVESGGGFPS